MAGRFQTQETILSPRRRSVWAPCHGIRALTSKNSVLMTYFPTGCRTCLSILKRDSGLAERLCGGLREN
jgi:hypothetical protein